MRISIVAVGRLRGGPEAELASDYVERFSRTGRQVGLGPARIVEVDDRKGGGSEAEAALLLRALPDKARICCLDERGKMCASPAFAEMLGNWRDQGQSDAAFVIGGADGLTPGLRAEADTLLSFGAMVWPHKLVRVMLAEQLYRAASILAGSPYHRA